MIRQLRIGRLIRALRGLILRRQLAAAEARVSHDLDEYLAAEAAASAAWREHPFPELDHDPEARAIAIRLHRQLAAEWHVPEDDR